MSVYQDRQRHLATKSVQLRRPTAAKELTLTFARLNEIPKMICAIQTRRVRISRVTAILITTRILSTVVMDFCATIQDWMLSNLRSLSVQPTTTTIHRYASVDVKSGPSSAGQRPAQKRGFLPKLMCLIHSSGCFALTVLLWWTVVRLMRGLTRLMRSVSFSAPVKADFQLVRIISIISVIGMEILISAHSKHVHPEILMPLLDCASFSRILLFLKPLVRCRQPSVCFKWQKCFLAYFNCLNNCKLM